VNCGKLNYRSAYGVLALGLLLNCVVEALAADDLQPTFRLDLTQKYPQLTKNLNSPIFHSTAQGQLVMIQGQCADRPHSALISDDQGRSWRKWEGFSTWPAPPYADVVRRGNELLAFTMEPNVLNGTHVWWSKDEGLTWAGGSLLVKHTRQWVPMNQRVLLTSGGRLLVPIDVLLGPEGPGPDNVGTLYSDDAGRSWKQSPLVAPPPGYPTMPEGIGEPATVELANEKIWMVARGLGGHLLQAWSTDGGATWGTPSATTLVSPLSAVSARRIPGTNAVVVCWDNAKPGASLDWLTVAFPRTPLVFAVSRDNCQTWSKPVIVDTSKVAIYPSICFSHKEMFLAYLTTSSEREAKDVHTVLAVYNIRSLP
jgi:hypothetical protein